MRYLSFWLLFSIAVFSLSCSKSYIRLSGFTQGTTYNIIYFSENEINYHKQIDSILRQFSHSLSVYDSTSIISLVNKNDSTQKIDTYFRTVFVESQKISEATNGLFDITVAPLINIWGFGQEQSHKPDSAEIDSILQYIGYEKVRLENGKVIKENPKIILNTNAIAQGYAVDVIAGFFDSNDIKNYMVEIGGELKTKGKNPKGECWKIGIDKPIENSTLENRQVHQIVALPADGLTALATSGNYRNFYEQDGKKYAHTISPQSGRPVVHNLLSATVLAETCLEADAYATAFMVMGLDKSLHFVKNHQKLEAYFIYSDKKGTYQVIFTNGFKKLLQ